MADDNKVNKAQVIRETTSRFLPAELRDTETTAEVYSLDHEFSKTGKTRNYRFYIILLLFLTLIGVATWLLTNYIQKKYNKVDLAISEFQDLKLKDLLEASKNNEKKLELLRKEHTALKEEKKQELEKVSQKYRELVEKVYAGNLSANAKETKVQELKKEESQKVSAVTTDYDKRIKEKETEINEVKKEMARNKAQMSRGVNQAENIVNNFNALHDLKMKQQKEKYEEQIADLILKYNPYITRGQAATAIRKYARTDSDIKLYNYERYLANYGFMRQGGFNELRAKIDNLEAVLNELQKVEYKNSVPGALNTIDKLNADIITTYEKLWFSMIHTLKRRDAYINQIESGLKTLSTSEKESGYLLDTKNLSKMRVFVNPVIRVQNNTIALVFRNDNEYIGKIELFPDRDGFLARVVEINEGNSPRPFDKILVDTATGEAITNTPKETPEKTGE